MTTLPKTLNSSNRFLKTAALSCLALLISSEMGAATLTSNLSVASAGTEAASGDTWLATSFTTDASGYSLGSVTLALADLTSSSVTASLALYTDDGLDEPGTAIGTLTTSSAYSSSLSDITFTGSNLGLSADTRYWVVLSSTTGELDWSYAANDSGTGTGFTDSYAESYDAGSTWYTYASNQNVGVYPLQMDVEAAAAISSATPEPATAPLLLMSGLIAACCRKLRKARASTAPSNFAKG
jgi:hypothetical protein